MTKRGANKVPASRNPPSELSPLSSRFDQFVAGIIQVEDLDIEELQQGRIKNHEGKWPMGPPKRLPGPLMNRVQRELNRRLLEEFNKYGIDAIETITQVMYNGEGASAYQGQKDGVKRLDAAKYVLERIVGPIPSKSENVTHVTVWEGMQETGGLFVDIEVEEIQDVPEAEPPARPRGRTARAQRKALPES